MDAFTDLSWNELVRVTLRLSTAGALGAVVGWERERHKRGAGLRTHILVAIGCATFMTLGMEMVVSQEAIGADTSRIVQGIATGIGFLGAGTILKLEDQQRIQGLTTAASIWATSAVGVAVGAGRVVLALVLVALTLVTLAPLSKVERADSD